MAADLPDSYFPENRVAPYFGWRQMGAAESSPPICSLCLLTNAGADAIASGSRCNRLWELMQPLLGADATASGSRYGRFWVQTRTHAGRDTIARGAAFAGKSASAFAEEKAGFVDFIFQRDV